MIPWRRDRSRMQPLSSVLVQLEFRRGGLWPFADPIGQVSKTGRRVWFITRSVIYILVGHCLMFG